jgi:hypothetical protein
VPKSHEVVLRREGNQIVIAEAGSDLRELAQAFAEDGLIEFNRPKQPERPEIRTL